MLSVKYSTTRMSNSPHPFSCKTYGSSFLTASGMWVSHAAHWYRKLQTSSWLLECRMEDVFNVVQNHRQLALDFSFSVHGNQRYFPISPWMAVVGLGSMAFDNTVMAWYFDVLGNYSLCSKGWALHWCKRRRKWQVLPLNKHNVMVDVKCKRYQSDINMKDTQTERMDHFPVFLFESPLKSRMRCRWIGITQQCN